ncbi:MAG: archaetidylserine decarboxylase [Chromatiales bacterium]
MAQGASLGDRLKSWWLYPLPHHLLSRSVLWLTRQRSRYTAAAIRWFSRRYQVDLSDALEPDPRAYPSFNAFFTRALRPGARPMPEATDAVACPVDGQVSELGQVEEGRILQAKGRDYSVYELLGGSKQRAAEFSTGHFITLYLSPRDYHRIHMPFGGSLRETVHVPGRLFSVAPHTTRAIPRLFARNERLACLFDTEIGPMAVVLVGAINVAAIETVWAGLVCPPRAKTISVERYGEPRPRVTLSRGMELGRFNMGSTVILLFGQPSLRWRDGLSAGMAVRVGETIAGPPPLG